MRYPMMIWAVLSLVLLSAPAGAAEKVIKDGSVPASICPTAVVSNDTLTATIMPVKDVLGNEWAAFHLYVTNKSDKEIQIVWNDSRYLRHGKEDGGFLFGGDNIKPGIQREPDIIPPKGTYSRVIWPGSRFKQSGEALGWVNIPMTSGDHGMLLVVKSGGSEMREKLSMDIDQQEKVCGIVPNKR